MRLSATTGRGSSPRSPAMSSLSQRSRRQRGTDNCDPRDAFGAVGSRSVVRVAAEQAERMSMDLAASAAERKARAQQTLVDRISHIRLPHRAFSLYIERFHQNCTLRTASLILPMIT